jgi:hypothetical protein
VHTRSKAGSKRSIAPFLPNCKQLQEGSGLRPSSWQRSHDSTPGIILQASSCWFNSTEGMREGCSTLWKHVRPIMCYLLCLSTCSCCHLCRVTSVLVDACCRKLGGQPDGSWLAGTAATTAAGTSNQQAQQQLISPREAADGALATAKAAAGPASCDDTRLLRPVDPAKPGYYWKPVKGDAAAAAAGQAVLHGGDNILGFQVTVVVVIQLQVQCLVTS